MGLEIILYAYLTGWVATSGYGAYQCVKEPVRVLTTEHCVTVQVVMGTMWPVAVYEEIKR